MKIIKETDSENCFDGGLIKEYRLDAPVTMELVEYLRAFGEVTVLKDIRKPFFTFDKERYFAIKGIIGEDMIRVIYRPEGAEDKVKSLRRLLEGYPPK